MLFATGACGSDDEGSAGSSASAVACEPSTNNATLIWCAESWSQCADGKSYEVECNGSAGAWVCKCRIDGVETASETGTDFCDVQPPDRTARSGELCGWNIE
jgi:hypothetical protein